MTTENRNAMTQLRNKQRLIRLFKYLYRETDAECERTNRRETRWVTTETAPDRE